MLKLDPSIYVTVLIDLVVTEQFRPPWIHADNSVNKTIKSYYDHTVILVNNYHLTNNFSIIQQMLPPGTDDLVNNYHLTNNFSIIQQMLPPGTDDLTLIKYAQLYEAGWLYARVARQAYELKNNISILDQATALIDMLRDSHSDGINSLSSD
ncbi:unnamed protein product [Gongylonema pulchrum]|uniref:DUF4125 family protein n=1 Tax=Gongylonema pulchrum TaxID=637853 RepID=A0A183ESZ0_9BILA|nr:unnamed protein product [Gongylonema pulchrum]